jgi:hypothetical protein
MVPVISADGNSPFVRIDDASAAAGAIEVALNHKIADTGYCIRLPWQHATASVKCLENSKIYDEQGAAAGGRGQAGTNQGLLRGSWW